MNFGFTLYSFETFFAAQSVSRLFVPTIGKRSYRQNFIKYLGRYKPHEFEILDQNFVLVEI